MIVIVFILLVGIAVVIPLVWFLKWWGLAIAGAISVLLIVGWLLTPLIRRHRLTLPTGGVSFSGFGKVLCALIIVAALGLGWKHVLNQEEKKAAVRAEVASKVQAIKANDPTLLEYEYREESYPDQDDRDDPRYVDPPLTCRAFVITDNRQVMTFRVEYQDLGVLRTALFSLDKTVPGKLKVGTWNQEKPRFSGQWFLKEKQDIKPGYRLSIKYDTRPDLGWRDASLTPK